MLFSYVTPLLLEISWHIPLQQEKWEYHTMVTTVARWWGVHR